MKRRIISILTTCVFALTVASVGIFSTNCGLITDLLSLIGLQLLGVTPGLNLGDFDFSLLGQNEQDKVSLQSLASSGLDVQVENDDGSMSPCDFVDEDIRGGSKYNTIAIVVDDSGSMENYYPYEEYEDLCLTCPHDPDRRRADAAIRLIDTILAEAPASRIGLFDFGPDPSMGMDATRILADFGSELDDFRSAAREIDGSEMRGTPMWDSLAELISVLSDEAEDFEGELMRMTPTREFEPYTPTDTTDDSLDIRVQRYIVVLGDGDDNIEYGGSDDYTLDAVIDMARRNNIVIHAVGLGQASITDESPLMRLEDQIATVRNLQRLADETGGFYASVDEPESLVELYEHIALSMSEGYQVDTYTCMPREQVGDPEGRLPDPGERIRGTLTFGSFTLPWSAVAD